MKIIFYGLILLVNMRIILCDLPVHCLAKDIAGDWLLMKVGSMSLSQ
jgi:hypothetical protein